MLGEPGEVLHDGIGGVAIALDGPKHEIAALGAQQVGSDAGEHQAAKALRVVAGEGEQHTSPQAEADAVYGAFGELGRHHRLHRVVGGRIVGPLRGAVTEQVDGYRLPADVSQKVEPPVVAPGAGAGRGEAVEQDDRVGHPSTLLSPAASSRLHDRVDQQSEQREPRHRVRPGELGGPLQARDDAMAQDGDRDVRAAESHGRRGDHRRHPPGEEP